MPRHAANRGFLLWTPLDEGLPPEPEGRPKSYLVTVRHPSETYVTRASFVGKKYQNPWMTHDHEYITHWMPMPQPPE